MSDSVRPSGTRGAEVHARSETPPRAASTTKLTVSLPVALVDELRDAVVALSGPPHRLTLTGVVRDAVTAELERLRAERGGRSRGRMFPRRREPLRAGRPIG